MELNKVVIYRITHIENILHILQHGITHRNSFNCNPNYKDIGDVSLIEIRRKRAVRIDNGLTELRRDCQTIILGDFIPFYFGVKMPMLYVAQHGGNFVERATPAEDIVYLGCSLSKLIASGIDFFFSDGHATDMLTSFYDKTRVKELSSIIDWEAVRISYWGGIENLNTKRKKHAEVLISSDLPADFIVGFGCYNDKAKERLISIGVSEEKIKTIPQAYY